MKISIFERCYENFLLNFHTLPIYKTLPFEIFYTYGIIAGMGYLKFEYFLPGIDIILIQF